MCKVIQESWLPSKSWSPLSPKPSKIVMRNNNNPITPRTKAAFAIFLPLRFMFNEIFLIAIRERIMAKIENGSERNHGDIRHNIPNTNAAIAMADVFCSSWFM